MTPKDEALEDSDELTEEEISNTEDDETISEQAVDIGVENEGHSELDQLKEALAKAQAKADENWDRVLRMQAEMDNTRKRLTQEVDNARKFGQKGMIEELLPVLDSMEIGLQAADAENAVLEKIQEGYALTAKMLVQMLDKFNVVEVNPVDEKFNPELHQAMSMQEDSDQEANTVLTVMQKGYTLNERLIRPALVIVAK